MKNTNRVMGSMLLSVSIASANMAMAQENEAAGYQLEEIQILGTRTTKPRSAADSPVPVDVISGDDFSQLGSNADITDNLKTMVPSFSATPATGDGSAFVRPTSLRGLAPDQTLVLVNGKRRHRSALIHFFSLSAGAGAHGVDIGMIPSIALKNVQVLRDGAASQYGSDAIAGVMNFELKDANDGGMVDVQWGQFFEGENSGRIAANYGFPLGDEGFFNVSAELWDNDQLSRGVQRPNAQALIDAGVQGVGADDPTGNGLAQTWGRTATSGLRTFFNAGVPFGDGELYAFGNYADTEGNYRIFYRDPGHSAVTTFYETNPHLLAEDVFSAGFTPLFDGNQQDTSLVVGYTTESDSGINMDFSVGLGQNELRYSYRNSLNPSLYAATAADIQREFDLGGYQQSEINVNLDFSQALSDTVNLAYGAEWREESYEVIAGEPNSTFGGGTTGYTPATEDRADTYYRDNYAAYADLEYEPTDSLLLQTALRYEDFSDFGGTLNGKIAGRFNVSDNTALRAAISTGFHAPTPGQANIETVITTFDGSTGELTLEGLVTPDSEAAIAAGGSPLSEETSVSYSAGITSALGPVDLTFDAYMIEVDGRIYRTGDIPNPLGASGTISFYTNALDVESKGLDIVATTDFDWGNANTDLTLAYNYNKLEVVGQSLVNGIQPVADSIVEDIENNYPNHRFVLTTNTTFGDNWNLMLRANYYGAHYDERGEIGVPGNQSWEISSTIFVDAELGYNFNDDFRAVLGVSNLFDEYPDEIPDDGIHANRQSVGLIYPRRTIVNYEGGSAYLRLTYNL